MPQPSSRFEVLDLSQVLTQDAPPIPWVLNPWLVRNNVVCLAGEPKAGKSWIALDLALALATGRKFLGEVVVEGGPYRVLYLDAENHETLIRRRIKQLVAGFDPQLERFPISALKYASVSLSLDSPEDFEDLRRRCNEFKPDFLVLDSFIRFHRRDENSNREMSGFYADTIRRLAGGDSSVVMIHHLGKPNVEGSSRLKYRVRGASDILAQVDQLWTVTAESDGTLTIRHEESRWADTAPDLRVSIEDVPEAGGVRLHAAEATPRAEEVVRSMLTKGERSGVLRKDIVGTLKEGGLRSAKRLATKVLGRLSAEGAVRKRSEGQEVRYWLTGNAPEGCE